MRRPSVADGFFFLSFILLILLPVDSFSKDRRFFLAEPSQKTLKKPDMGTLPGSGVDGGLKQAPSYKTQTPLAQPAPPISKPDIVLTHTLEMSLQDVIANTLKNNVSIAIQNFQSQIRKQEIITQEAEFDPSLSLEGKATKGKQPLASAFVQPPVSKTSSQSLDLSFNQKLKTGTEYELRFKNERSETNSTFAGLEPQYTTRFEVNLTQPLLKNFGQDINSSNITIAKNNLDISDFEFKNKVIEVISEAENVYWDLVFSREDLKVQQKSVQRAKDLERRVKAQVEVGTMAPLEILQAQSEVASREEAVIQARKRIQDNQDNLKNILNIPFDSPDGMKEIQLLDSPQFLIETPVSLKDSIRTALMKRPDHLSKKKELDNKNILVKFNENQLYPTLDLVASFGLNGISGDAQAVGFPPSVNPLGGNFGRSQERTFSGDASTWEGGLLFKYPLGNRAAKSRFTAAKLAAAQLLMDIKDLEKTIVLEVREAARQINTDKKRVQAARIARKLAEETLSAEEKKFEVGLSTSFSVLEFQTDLAEQQSKELKAIIDFNKSKIKFRKVLATTLEEYNIQMASDFGP
ncbi:MAG: TolC family protein [Nitrospinae bacterium]|nr:TolC family protein [Nitrospinota bacterium]